MPIKPDRPPDTGGTKVNDELKENSSGSTSLSSIDPKEYVPYKTVGQHLKLQGSTSKTYQMGENLPLDLCQEVAELEFSEKEKVIGACVTAYARSVAIYETVAANVAMEHPDSKLFADELLRRLFAVAGAYAEEKTVNEAHLQELKRRLLRDIQFICETQGAGSVGQNLIAIEKVVKSGTLREQLVASYCALWYLVPIAFSEPAMVSAINGKLQNFGFQLNTELIDQMREFERVNPSPLKHGQPFFRNIDSICAFRGPEGMDTGRLKRSTEPTAISNSLVNIPGGGSEVKPVEHTQWEKAQHDLSKPSIGEIKATDRELRMILGDPLVDNLSDKVLSRPVSWCRGKDIYHVDPKSDFYQRAIGLGCLPIVTGPCGTMDNYLLACKYLNMEEYMEKGLLAVCGWLVHSGDHSLHEIRSVGADIRYGIPYEEGPKAFERFYRTSGDVDRSIQKLMAERGVKLPGYYLTHEYQKLILQQTLLHRT